MLVAILRLVVQRGSTGGEIVYVGATKMAEWMSGQVTGYRSVIGYAGEMWPSRPTRLVVLMGFEFARARSIIDNFEPKTLVLGKGSRSESITPELAEKNDEFYRALRSQYDNVEATFEFSARDPVRVAEELEEAVPLDSSSNVIIAPLHTKLSTIGAGLFAQRHRTVQICYAPVEAYNEQAYSTPGAEAFLLPRDALL